MNPERTAILAVVAFACGVAAFFNARRSALARQEDRQWLSEASANTIELEKDFAERMDELKSNLAAEQGRLASALDDPCTPNSVVLEHTEKVIAAHESLMRAVGRHVVGLRAQLAAEDRDYLMGLCAQSVRGPMCRRGAGGQGCLFGDGKGNGRGRGPGRGGGGGYGIRMRRRNRLARILSLTQEQSGVLGAKDADFEADSIRLREELMGERAKLLAEFENPSSSSDGLLEQIERMISAYSQIERRIAEHVLVVRPYLTVEQQKWLIGLCRREFGAEGRK